MLTTEAIRTAMRKFGNKASDRCTGTVGARAPSLTATALKEMERRACSPRLRFCAVDHEGGGGVTVQQWDGTQWIVLTDWITPDQALVRPLVEASAARYAQEKGITPRTCP